MYVAYIYKDGEWQAIALGSEDYVTYCLQFHRYDGYAKRVLPEGQTPTEETL